MLINSSYFVGDRDIPNTSDAAVNAALETCIRKYEKKYLQDFLGYELYKNFNQGLLAPTPDQRYVDLLFGKEFISLDGRLTKWEGFVSVTSDVQNVSVDLNETPDIVFTVGAPGGPADGASSYVNPDLAGKNFRVTQRGYGPLEALLADDSNVDYADIEIRPEGGFDFLAGYTFSLGDKYFITLLSAAFDVSEVEIAEIPESPIADYVYFQWLKENVSQNTGIGQKRAVQINAVDVSPKYKMARAWNDMVRKNIILRDMLLVYYDVYPEWQNQNGYRETMFLLTKTNPHF